MRRTHPTLPSIQTGYPLDDVFSIIVPIARTNLITNPSFETATTNWTAIGGSIARSTTYQYHGAYSLAITPTAATTDGARYDTVSLTSGTTYAYSAKVKGVAGLKYKLCVETTGAVELTSYTFTATGRWQWVYGFYTETSSTTRRITVRKAAHTSTAVFYLDGVQVEACGSEGVFVTTYCDGDQPGLVPNQYPPAYLWTGTPHASTSQRSGQTRAGGRVLRFKDYNFFITAIIGLGLAVPQNVATNYARIDGGYDDYTRKPARQFTLAGQFNARTYQQLRDLRGGLAQLLDRDLVGQDQRLVIRHHLEDARGNVLSDEVYIPAKYAGGLDGKTDNQYTEQAPITFTQYAPFVQGDGRNGAALTVQQSVSDADMILQRSPTGVWSAMGTGGVGALLNALARGLDNSLYAGGDFTSMGGVANTSRIAKWDGSAWSALDVGANSTVYALAVGPDGSLYAGGNFSSIGGVATTGIARWNGSAWSALGTGASAASSVFALTVGPDGSLYAGGSFTSMGGVANTGGIAKWNGSAWSALGTGTGGSPNNVFSITVAKDGTVYAGGSFINIGGVAVNNIGKWNGSAWSAMAGGSNATVAALALGANGLLYAGGSFTSIGGITTTGIAYWNGTAWSSLGSGLNGNVNALIVTPNGEIWAVGTFTTAGGITIPNAAARWNSAAWVPFDVILPGVPAIGAINRAADGTIAIGFTTTGTATSAAVTTATNNGTARTYPTLTIKGPSSGTSRIYQIVDYTTGRAIYLNYTINAGETARLVFTPDNLSFTSDFQGNIASKILPGSNEADFFFQPGANTISFFAADNTVTATLEWNPCYASLDDVP